MVVVQDRSLRKPSGGRYKDSRTKRLALTGKNASLTNIGQKRIRSTKKRGNGRKEGLLSSDIVNIFDQKTGKHYKAKLKEVKENAANRNYVRRNIITKGAVVETDKGMAIVTNRPGQEGIINAILKK